MARPLRIAFPGALYHLISRGNNRERVFLGDNDCTFFFDVLGHVVDRFGWRCHSYCALGNHYHLLVETPSPNVSIGMRQLNGVYAQAFNRRHDRVGHVFQSRFHSVLVQGDPYLREVVRYIARNPVKAKLCDRAEDWRWSSFRALLGLAPPAPFLTTDWVLGQFGEQKGVARDRLRAFVRRDEDDVPLIGGVYAATEAFVASCLADLEPVAEVPRREWQPVRPPLQDVFTRERLPVVAAYRRYGYTLREIALHLGCHYATVSRRLRREEAA